MNTRKRVSFLASIMLILGMMTLNSPAIAQLNGVTIDFAGATPTTFDRSSGSGGAWSNGVLNSNIERSLEGSSFACEDRIVYLGRVDVGNRSP